MGQARDERIEDKMTLTQLRFLLAIVDCGLNITLAAERANATQPGVSKQLKQLEDELGLRLFVRRGRNLESLTEAGTEIVGRARIIVAEADNIRALASNEGGRGGGALFIETTLIQAQCVLPGALAALGRRYPEVDVTLGFAADADDVGRRNANADMTLFSTDGRLPGGDVAIPLYRWDPVAIVPLDHPLVRHGGAITLEALAAWPLITYDTSRTAPLSIARTFHEAGLSPRFAYTVRDAGVTKTAVRNGIGVGLLAEMAIAPGGDADLAVLSLAGLFPRCTAWAVLRRDRVLRDPAAYLLGILSGMTPLALRRAAAGEPLPLKMKEAPLWSSRAAIQSAAPPDRSGEPYPAAHHHQGHP
jgi:LysR family transcriptional regulator, cys regulon transcriptional activator